eukprot:8281545-Alexandrium_andersonii.AAC.1
MGGGGGASRESCCAAGGGASPCSQGGLLTCGQQDAVRPLTEGAGEGLQRRRELSSLGRASAAVVSR